MLVSILSRRRTSPLRNFTVLARSIRCGKSRFHSWGHVRALGHEAHVAEIALVHYLPELALVHAVEFPRGALVNQVEQGLECIAQIHAASASVTDVEHRLDLLEQGRLIPKSDDFQATARRVGASKLPSRVFMGCPVLKPGPPPPDSAGTSVGQPVQGLLEAIGMGPLGLGQGVEPVGNFLEPLVPRRPGASRGTCQCIRGFHQRWRPGD